jgi:hypothetical protein
MILRCILTWLPGGCKLFFGQGRRVTDDHHKTLAAVVPPTGEPPPTYPWTRSSIKLGLLLAGTVLARCLFLNQPIVENYVGRQVPTAMVARNLERGSGVLWPQLDTAPFPSYFLVEPPIYQAVVLLGHRLWGGTLESSGRMVSALASGLAAWGLFGLVRRRDGEQAGFAAVMALAVLPVTLRYGRAFQPDALMLGTILAGANCWDRACTEGGGKRLWGMAWLLLAAGIAVKIFSAFVLIPLAVAGFRQQKRRPTALLATTLFPALAWYAWANHLLETGGGSRAAIENRAIWMAAVGISALGTAETQSSIARFLLLRAFTPIGLPLAAWGLRRWDGIGRRPWFWRIWGLSALATMALLAGKLHHEYYWLSLTPVVAAGLGRAWHQLIFRSRGLAVVIAGGFLILCFLAARSTWRTPSEWRFLASAAVEVQRTVPSDVLLVAPEPLLYYADRRGCRLEFTPAAVARAAAEWGSADGIKPGSAAELVEFYRRQGVCHFADLAAAPEDPNRVALQRWIRERYKVVVDRDSVLIAELQPIEPTAHGR